MRTKHLHDKGCSCLKEPAEKCDCKQGLSRKVQIKAKTNLKRAKLVITEVTQVGNGPEVEWTWDSERECRVGKFSKVPFGKGKIGRYSAQVV